MTDTPTSLTIMHITDIHFGDAAPLRSTPLSKPSTR